MRIIVLITLILFLTFSPLAGSDWPQWRGPNRNGISEEKGLLDKWPETGPEKVWEKEIGTPTKSYVPACSPVVADGKVFIVGQKSDGKKLTNTLYCLNANNGTLIWKHAVKAARYNPPHSTPAVANGRIHVVDGLGGLYCFQTEDGTLLWEKKPKEAAQNGTVRSKWSVASSPLVDGETVYLGFHAFNAQNGAPVFVSAATYGGHSSTVLGMINGRKCIISHDQGIDAETGKELWKITRCGGICTPVWLDDRLLNMGVDPGGEKKITPHARVYRIKTDAEQFKPEKIWAAPNLKNSGGHTNYMVPSFTVSNKHVYGRFGYKYLTLTCFDITTGKVNWSVRKETGMNGSCFSSLILADRKLYCTDGTGQLFMIKDDPKGLTVLGKAKVCGKISASPALADGFLYLSDGVKLICLRVK